MSFDLGDLRLITDRPGAAPAPTFGPGDKPDTGPGNGDRPGPCHRSNEQMSTDARTVTAELWAAIGRSRRARGADTELREVA